MKKSDLKLMSADELWALHEVVAQLLTAKITAEKRELEERLRRLSGGSHIRLAESRSPRDTAQVGSQDGRVSDWGRRIAGTATRKLALTAPAIGQLPNDGVTTIRRRNWHVRPECRCRCCVLL
jgi:hypothetical protein